jgi:hypothetical protein
MFNLQLLDTGTKLLLERIIAYLRAKGFDNMNNPVGYLANTATPSGTDMHGNHWARDESFWTVYDWGSSIGGVTVIVGIDPDDEDFDENQTVGVIPAQITMQVDEIYHVVDQYGWNSVVLPQIRALLFDLDVMRNEY